MEIRSFDELERRVTKFLEELRQAKSERDELSKRVSGLEAENTELKHINEKLKKELKEARQNARDPEKEKRIKTKVDDMLAKLEGF